MAWNSIKSGIRASSALKYQYPRSFHASINVPQLWKPVTEITHPDTVSQATADKVASFEEYTINTYARPNIVLSSGKGSTLTDVDGRTYLDFTAGIAVTALGHADPQVAKVISDQSHKLIHTSNLYHNEHAGDLARLLVETTRSQGGSWASKVFLTNSGTEANEGALKFARKWGKLAGGPDKFEIVSFTNGFHGRSMGALSATYNPKYQTPFAPLVPGFVVCPYNDTEQALNAINEKTCGVIVEPIQGEGGVYAASPEFLRALRQRCDEVKALLIYDEIQCGLGRTGKLWGHLNYGKDSVPDVLTLAKPLANGVPIGAIMTNAKVGESMKVGEHGTTFGGNPLATAVAKHVLGRISHPDFLGRVEETGSRLVSYLKDLQSKYPDLINDVRGKGLLLGLGMTRDPAPIVKLARERGLLVVTASNQTIRIIPPLTVTDEECRTAMGRLEGALIALRDA